MPRRTRVPESRLWWTGRRYEQEPHNWFCILPAGDWKYHFIVAGTPYDATINWDGGEISADQPLIFEPHIEKKQPWVKQNPTIRESDRSIINRLLGRYQHSKSKRDNHRQNKCPSDRGIRDREDNLRKHLPVSDLLLRHGSRTARPARRPEGDGV